MNKLIRPGKDVLPLCVQQQSIYVQNALLLKQSFTFSCIKVMNRKSDVLFIEKRTVHEKWCVWGGGDCIFPDVVLPKT